MTPRKKVAVVGGGFSGIGSVAILKTEGLEPVCFERSDKIGGTWCYRQDSKYGQASIMPTTVINHSKEMGAVSNFPPKKEYNNFMKHSELYQYMTEFVKHYDVENYVRYNTEVVHVKKADDYEVTGRWSVTTKDLITNETNTDIYDGVIVATGHINMPIMPKFPEQEKFTGKIIHTHSLKEVDEFSDQNVVIVGIGCSALDAAVEISRVAKQVYLSTRSGGFILNRVGPNGDPIDTVLLRRCLVTFIDILPTNFVSWYIETFYINKFFDKGFYKIKPKYRVLSREPIVNDHIGHKLLTGAVKQKGDIHYFTEDGIVFDDEKDVTKIDSVIMATGYTWSFPFLDDGIIVKDDDGRINLYKCMYPTHLPHPTLAIIGFLYPFGPGFPIGELQIRWAAYLMAGHGKLPPESVMIKDVVKRHESNTKRYYPGNRMTVRVDYMQYMDEIAKELGVMPNFLKYLLTDFRLFMRLIFGPCLSYQYRLEGHGKWEGARDAIMTYEDRMHFPVCERRPERKGNIQRIIEYAASLLPFNFYIWHH